MLPQLYRHAWMDGEIDAFREQVRRYVAAEFTPRLDEWRRQGYIPREVWRPFGEMSFLLPEMPETYGGAGASLAYQLVVQDELAKAEMPVNIAVHTIASHYILDFGTEAQKQRWLPKVTNGEMLAAIAMTEPGCGSDLKAISTRARRDGDHYVIDGEKTSISAADQADATVVFARTGTVESSARGVSAILVPMDTPGVTTTRFDCHGQRAIGRGSIFFQNARVPASHLLGQEGQGFVQVMQGFDFSRALIGLQVLAVARVALEETWEYVAQREAFGKPLSAFQGVSHPLADYETQVEAARLLCLQTLWLKDKGLPHTAEAAMCKWWGPKLAYDTVHQCLLSFGHGGYDRGLMEQRLRDVLGFQIGDGTAQIMKTIIARGRAGRGAVPA